MRLFLTCAYNPFLLLLIAILFFAGSNANGQEQINPVAQDRGWFVFGTFARGAALKGDTYGPSLTVITPGGWGGSFNYRVNKYHARKLPADYGASFCLFGGDCTPTDQVTMVSLHLLKTFSLKRTKLVRFVVEGGPSIVHYTETSFSPDTVWHGFLYTGPKYISSETTKSTVGASLRGLVAFPLSRGCGIEAGLFSNVNCYHSVLGFECCFTAGLMRDRVHPAKKQE